MVLHGQTVGRTDTTDRITVVANAVGKGVGPNATRPRYHTADRLLERYRRLHCWQIEVLPRSPVETVDDGGGSDERILRRLSS